MKTFQNIIESEKLQNIRVRKLCDEPFIKNLILHKDNEIKLKRILYVSPKLEPIWFESIWD